MQGPDVSKDFIEKNNVTFYFRNSLWYVKKDL